MAENIPVTESGKIVWSDVRPSPLGLTKSDIGAIGALAKSKKYGITAVVVGAAVGLSVDAAMKGDVALAISALWPASVTVCAYVLGQAAVEACAAARKP